MARQRATPAEAEALLTFLLTLRLDRVRDFLGRHDLPRYGTRADLRDRLQEKLAEGRFTVVDLVDFLDEVEPWGKQHVFLYDGGDGLVGDWQDAEAIRRRLAEVGLERLLDERTPLALPE